MRGLLRKDLELMALNKKFLVMVVAMALFITAAGTEATFIQAYLGFMAIFMVVSSLSYDEIDGSMAYLLTLPASRKDYVKEKYLLAVLFTGIACVLGTALAFLINSMKKSAVPLEAIGVSFLVSVLFSCIFAAVLLPVIIKYGSEKGRIVIMLLFAGVFGCMSFLKKIIKLEAMDAQVTSFLEGAGPVILTLGALTMSVIILMISCSISIRILEKKEF